jgi:hypothetical protein
MWSATALRPCSLAEALYAEYSCEKQRRTGGSSRRRHLGSGRSTAVATITVISRIPSRRCHHRRREGVDGHHRLRWRRVAFEHLAIGPSRDSSFRQLGGAGGHATRRWTPADCAHAIATVRGGACSVSGSWPAYNERCICRSVRRQVVRLLGALHILLIIARPRGLRS